MKLKSLTALPKPIRRSVRRRARRSSAMTGGRAAIFRKIARCLRSGRPPLTGVAGRCRPVSNRTDSRSHTSWTARARPEVGQHDGIDRGHTDLRYASSTATSPVVACAGQVRNDVRGEAFDSSLTQASLAENVSIEFLPKAGWPMTTTTRRLPAPNQGHRSGYAEAVIGSGTITGSRGIPRNEMAYVHGGWKVSHATPSITITGISSSS